MQDQTSTRPLRYSNAAVCTCNRRGWRPGASERERASEHVFRLKRDRSSQRRRRNLQSSYTNLVLQRTFRAACQHPLKCPSRPFQNIHREISLPPKQLGSYESYHWSVSPWIPTPTKGLGGSPSSPVSKLPQPRAKSQPVYEQLCSIANHLSRQKNIQSPNSQPDLRRIE